LQGAADVTWAAMAAASWQKGHICLTLSMRFHKVIFVQQQCSMVCMFAVCSAALNCLQQHCSLLMLE
jgi:hypothetical protein